MMRVLIFMVLRLVDHEPKHCSTCSACAQASVEWACEDEEIADFNAAWPY